MKVLIAAGGTGGHLFPGLALAEELRRRGANVILAGTEGGPELKEATTRDFEFIALAVTGRKKGISPANIGVAISALRATMNCLGHVSRIDPDVVVGMGGYLSLPVGIAAWTQRVPLVIHEQNATPGLANRLLATMAAAAGVAFEQAAARIGRPAVLTGTPLREAIVKFDRERLRRPSFDHFELEDGRRTVLILGGSQGARSVNESMLAMYESLRAERSLQVLHLTGPARYDEVRRGLAEATRPDDSVLWRPVAFTDRMDLAYAAADVVISRAGASTLAELAAVSVPAVLIPLPGSIDQDQLRNAEIFASAGAARLAGGEDSAADVWSLVRELLGNEEALGAMRSAMSSLSRPRAAVLLADLVMTAGGVSPPSRATFLPVRSAHLVGIGGAGMSALARVLKQGGVEVTGCDRTPSPALESLRDEGIHVEIGHDARHAQPGHEIVYSNAIPHDIEELQAARAQGIPVTPRAEALARAVSGKRVIAVSGSHGKGTTCGMIVSVLDSLGEDATYLIGADLAGGRPGGHLGRGGLAVVEADEAFGSFLTLRPAIAVLTNADEDHLDHYETANNLWHAFEQFLAAAGEKTVVCADHPVALQIASRFDSLTYGLSMGSEVTAADVSTDAWHSRFRLIVREQDLGEVSLSAGGLYNVQNALGAAASCFAAGVEPGRIALGLATFLGEARRFEPRGRFAGAELVDDYAHLPAEVTAALERARRGEWRRVIAVFQPHLYTRTRDMADEFGDALSAADVVAVTEIFAARESEIPGVGGKLVVDAVCRSAPGKRVAFLPTLELTARFLEPLVREGDLVLGMGAGDITTLPQLLGAVEANAG